MTPPRNKRGRGFPAALKAAKLAQAQEVLADGRLSQAGAAFLVGISAGCLSRWLGEARGPWREPDLSTLCRVQRLHRTQISNREAVQAEVARLRALRLPMGRICEELGLDASTLRKWRIDEQQGRGKGVGMSK